MNASQGSTRFGSDTFLKYRSIGACALVPALLAGCAHPGPLPIDQSAPTMTLAQTIAAMPRGIERAEGPALQRSIEAAQIAVQTCEMAGAKVSVLIADSAGEPVVLLSGDGAGMRSQLITRSKVAIVMRYRMASGDVIARAEQDPAIVAEAEADPEIGMLRGGGFPVMAEGRFIGALAVSGATLERPGLDERCAMAAVAHLEQE